MSDWLIDRWPINCRLTSQCRSIISWEALEVWSYALLLFFERCRSLGILCVEIRDFPLFIDCLESRLIILPCQKVKWSFPRMVGRLGGLTQLRLKPTSRDGTDLSMINYPGRLSNTVQDRPRFWSGRST